MYRSPQLGTDSFILIGVCAGLVALLDYIGVVVIPVTIPQVSIFYIGAAFQTAIAVWFGYRGLLGIYIGLVIATLFEGTFSIFVFVGSIGSCLGAAVPMLVFRYGKLNAELRSWKDIGGFVFSATICQNVISAVTTLYPLAFFGIIPYDALPVALASWLIGDAVVSIIIGIPLLRGLTRPVMRLSLVKRSIPTLST